jgi:predicted SnoaL-like aldol condensation-catalyzing enzyme
MTPLTQHAAPTEAVTAFFNHLRAGHIELALKCWAPDALWHVTGRSSRARDYTPEQYLAMCRDWYAEYPQYTAEFGEISSLGELTFLSIRSQNGEAPGSTEGMMLYRVVDGLIVEGWAIPAKHGDRYTF